MGRKKKNIKPEVETQDSQEIVLREDKPKEIDIKTLSAEELYNLKLEIENNKETKQEEKDFFINAIDEQIKIKTFKGRKVIFRSFLSPGDITTMTAAIRDLHLNHPGKFLTDVETSCGELWENNPYLTTLDSKDPTVEVIDLDNYDKDLIHRSNNAPYHFLHGYTQNIEDKLGVRIRMTDFKGDIHLSDDEKKWISQTEELGLKNDFWIIIAGGKYDYTAKYWNPDYYQEVVDHFKGRIDFVQCGEESHFHPILKNTLNLIGKTDLRQFIRLTYHSVGVICPVTFAMHAAAAVPVKEGKPLNRACVVVAGGREPQQWEAYPHHRFMSTNGALDCCDNGGCWKSRCQKVGDGDDKDVEGLCVYPITIKTKVQIPRFDYLSIPKCMHMIKPRDVIRQIEYYYEGGALKYQSSLFSKENKEIFKDTVTQG